VLAFAIAAAVTALLFAFYLRPLLQGWNGGETWGYSVAHASLALIGQLGWLIACLTAVLGGC
jgi:inner membrane protein involved in colicin E2 resistance